MTMIPQSPSHPIYSGSRPITYNQGSHSFTLIFSEETKKEISIDHNMSRPDVSRQQGPSHIKSKKDDYISNQEQSWAHECSKEIKALDAKAAQEGLPPLGHKAKEFAEIVFHIIVKFPDPFPRPQIYVDDDGAIVFYFVWQHSFVSIDFWPEKILCLSTINGARREYFFSHEKRHNVIAPFFQELRRLISEATKEGE